MTRVRILSQDLDGGFFPSMRALRSYNPDNPDAYIYSVLDQMENYRENGVFHLRICYWEIIALEFPCNEWLQSSNFIEETEVSGFEAVELAWNNFVGLRLTPDSVFSAVENGANYHYGVGNLRAYNWGIFGPGMGYYNVYRVDLYIATSKNMYSDIN